ncbi:MAG: hypothetical protein JWM47_3570 [Acidimicrobiales bacterium]|nr:hypothetical protein [Acidimicrobiales bacterium]
MRGPRRRAAALLVAVLVAGLLGCSGDSDGPPPGGGAAARDVIDLHIAASRHYDLAATCELFTPAKRAQMADFDRTEAEGYCTRATQSAVDDADAETKARTRRIYTDPVVTEVDRPGGTWFRIEAADGSYREEVETVEVDGRWWVQQVESDLDAHQHDDEGEGHVEGEPEPGP